MRDLLSVPIALVLGLIVAGVAYLVLLVVVVEIHPLKAAFEDFSNSPTLTIENNLGIAKIIVASWAGLMLLGFIFLAPATNAVSDTRYWSFGLVGRGWKLTQNVRFSLCSGRRSHVLAVLLLIGVIAAITLR